MAQGHFDGTHWVFVGAKATKYWIYGTKSVLEDMSSFHTVVFVGGYDAELLDSQTQLNIRTGEGRSTEVWSEVMFLYR